MLQELVICRDDTAEMKQMSRKKPVYGGRGGDDEGVWVTLKVRVSQSLAYV
jgi:hypothetical protein